MSSLAFVAIFFSVDGSAVAARSPEDCPIEQGTFLWFTLVALFSVLLNFLPRSLECHLARRDFIQEKPGLLRNRQLFMQRCSDVAFWILSLGLSLIHLLVVTSFLANLSEADEHKWLFTFGVVLVRELLIVPLLACLFSGLGTEASLRSRAGEPILPPKKLGLDLQHGQMSNADEDGGGVECRTGGDPRVWSQKVQELAGMGPCVRGSALSWVEGLIGN